ncbi:MAG: hypothetical protein K2Y39_28495 [Candidatus Obscuribacterales bacterium]|nr:hypothetical protein [Candidatus Obscuribacterales bacterium]
MMNFNAVCRVVRLAAFWRNEDEHSVLCEFLAEAEMFAFAHSCSIYTAHLMVCKAWEEIIRAAEAA